MFLQYFLNHNFHIILIKMFEYCYQTVQQQFDTDNVNVVYRTTMPYILTS